MIGNDFNKIIFVRLKTELNKLENTKDAEIVD